MILLVHGKEMSVSCQHGKWYGRWYEEGKRCFLSFGENDPRENYPVLATRKWARSTTVLRRIDGKLLACRADYSYCNKKKCGCRERGVRHGPYWKAHYWDKEKQKIQIKYIGTILPEPDEANGENISVG